MPTINIYLSEKEFADLLKEAAKLNVRLPVFIRKIVREWLLSHGYGVD